MNGRDLSIPHGAPVRLRVETQLGYKSMKYLQRIVVKDEFDDGGKKGTFRTDGRGMRVSECGRSPNVYIKLVDSKYKYSFGSIMKFTRYLSVVLFLLLCAAWTPVGASVGSKQSKPWRAVHLLDYNSDSALDALGQNLENLAKQGINTIILEVDYNFAFKSHPELRRGTNPITRDGARRFAALCKKFNIRLIPEFQSLGHQSWKAETFSLLTVYPAFDLTPGAFPNNEGIYCREWDPLNPDVWRIVFQLMDEIIDAFRADAFHVGMDEIFLLGSELSPSTKGKDSGALFAKAVNEIYAHLVRKRHVEMLMWGDRLIDGKKYDFGRMGSLH